MKKIKHVVAIVLAVLGIVVILQNTESIETELLFLKLEMPLAILIFLGILIGFVLGVLVSLIFSAKRKRK